MLGLSFIKLVRGKPNFFSVRVVLPKHHSVFADIPSLKSLSFDGHTCRQAVKLLLFLKRETNDPGNDCHGDNHASGIKAMIAVLFNFLPFPDTRPHFPFFLGF